MVPDSPIPFSGTPRRRMLSPGSNTAFQKNLRSFPTASKIRKSLALGSLNTVDMNAYTREEETHATSNTEEYIPPKYIVAHEDMRELVNNFMKQFDSILKEWSDLAKEKKLKGEKKISSLKDHEKKLETDFASIQDQSNDISKQLNIEMAQENDLSTVIANLNSQNEELLSAIKNLTTKRNIMENELSHKVNEINSKKKLTSEMLLLCSDEVKLLENLLGIEIISEGPEELTFVFSRLMKDNPKLSVKLRIDLSKFYFKVPFCSIKVHHMEKLIDHLNETRDFFGFLKNARAEIVKQLSA